MRQTFIACLISVITLGCTTTVHRVNKLSPGMTKEEVVRVMGNPQMSTSPGAGVEILHYRLRRMRYPLKVPLMIEYRTRFVDGRLDAYGTPKDMTEKLTSQRNIQLPATPTPPAQ